MDRDVFARMTLMDQAYAKMGTEATEALVNRGEKLVQKHGEENLQGKDLSEEELRAVGSFFEYRLAREMVEEDRDYE